MWSLMMWSLMMWSLLEDSSPIALVYLWVHNHKRLGIIKEYPMGGEE